MRILHKNLSQEAGIDSYLLDLIVRNQFDETDKLLDVKHQFLLSDSEKATIKLIDYITNCTQQSV
jgi:hypothetical protein